MEFRPPHNGLASVEPANDHSIAATPSTASTAPQARTPRPMTLPSFDISPIQLAPIRAAERRATKILSILDPDQDCPTFEADHHILRFHDVEQREVGSDWVEPPKQEHVASIISFARTLNPDDRVLVHCAMGVSRSPAAVLIMVATLTRSPHAAVGELARIIPCGSYEPNRLMIRLADGQLRMGGALVRHIPHCHRLAPDPNDIW